MSREAVKFLWLLMAFLLALLGIDWLITNMAYGIAPWWLAPTMIAVAVGLYSTRECLYSSKDRAGPS